MDSKQDSFLIHCITDLRIIILSCFHTSQLLFPPISADSRCDFNVTHEALNPFQRSLSDTDEIIAFNFQFFYFNLQSMHRLHYQTSSNWSWHCKAAQATTKVSPPARPRWIYCKFNILVGLLCPSAAGLEVVNRCIHLCRCSQNIQAQDQTVDVYAWCQLLLGPKQIFPLGPKHVGRPLSKHLEAGEVFRNTFRIVYSSKYSFHFGKTFLNMEVATCMKLTVTCHHGIWFLSRNIIRHFIRRIRNRA